MPPQVAHIPVDVALMPWQTSPVPQAVAAPPAQQMSPAAAPHAKHIIAVPAPPEVVHRAPLAQVLFAQQMPPGEPQSAQMPALSQTAPGSQLFPAQ